MVPENHEGTAWARRSWMLRRYHPQKYLVIPHRMHTRSVYLHTDPASGFTRFMELRLDTMVYWSGPLDEMPQMPVSIMDQHSNRLMKLNWANWCTRYRWRNLCLKDWPWWINDVTEQAVITEIKTGCWSLTRFRMQKDIRNWKPMCKAWSACVQLSIGITRSLR